MDNDSSKPLYIVNGTQELMVIVTSQTSLQSFSLGDFSEDISEEPGP